MCGLAGYIGTSSAHTLSRPLLRRMADAIAHRGPDDEGYFEDQTPDGTRVGLAHRRLSIIDLATGHQPMGNETGRVQIVFNGEIYNFRTLRDELGSLGHRFATNSDTETIVHAYEEWGPDCVTRLRGMFAFAIWDADRQRLVLARDRFGKKPLFLRQQGGLLLFASEIKSLLTVPGDPPTVDRKALRDHLLYRYVPGPRTLFAGTHKLEPGCLAIWERGTLRHQRYYSPPDQAPFSASAPPADVPGAFLDRLDEAVRIRMISDVPFGAFLSGGLDSSTIVALMTRHCSEPVKTFSVGFAEAGYSELAYARAVAEQFRTEHQELLVSQGQVTEFLPQVTRFRDAPVTEPSDIPIYLLSLAARHSVKMVLTGEGADEFLGGYPKHVFERWAPAAKQITPWLRRRLIEPLVRRLPYDFHRTKTAVMALGIDAWRERMPRWFGAISEAECQALFGPADLSGRDDEAPQFAVQAGNSSLRSILYYDQTSWLPDNLLERGDRMTMAASIEARMPFLDHELAAFVSSLPDDWRIRRLKTKRVLRLASRRLLPRNVLERPKVGFRVPVNAWFRGPMRDYLLDHLTGADSRIGTYFHRDTIERYVREHLEGVQNHEKLLWMLLSLEVWHREFGVRA